MIISAHRINTPSSWKVQDRKFTAGGYRTSQQQQNPTSQPTTRSVDAAVPDNIHETTQAGWIIIGFVLFFTFAGLIVHYFFIHLPGMQKEKEKRILAKQANQIKG